MDQQPINSNSGTRHAPGLKLAKPSDWCDVAIVDEEKVPAYVFGTRERAVTKAGDPKTQDLVTVLYIKGVAVFTDADRTVRLAVPGDVYSIYFEGQDRWDPERDKMSRDGFRSWSGAKELRGQLCRGDVMRWRYEADVQGMGAQPRKIRTVLLRAADATTEATQVARCNQLFASGTAQPIGNASAAAPAQQTISTPSYTYTDEEPF